MAVTATDYNAYGPPLLNAKTTLHSPGGRGASNESPWNHYRAVASATLPWDENDACGTYAMWSEHREADPQVNGGPREPCPSRPCDIGDCETFTCEGKCAAGATAAGPVARPRRRALRCDPPAPAPAA